MHKYRLIAKKGEGTFSEVLKAQCVKNGKMTAIKCMKSQFESEEQVNNLREIQALRRLSPHPGIIRLVEVLYEQPTGRLALVFELMDMNIYELIRGRRQYLAESRIKSFMYQLIKAMDHMHRNGIFHRDVKPENILVMDDALKLADFGSCRGIYSKQPYTEYISTRWYRAPECLLTDGYYNYKMDLWGVGCVFFEMVSLYPLFPGTNELDQIHRIHNILGTPPPEVLEKFKKHATHMELNFPEKEGSGIDKLITHADEDCRDVIKKLLTYNPDERPSARQALRHPYLKELRDLDKKAQAHGDVTKDSQAPSASGSVADGGMGQTTASSTFRMTSKKGDPGLEGGDASSRALPTIKHHHNPEQGAAAPAPLASMVVNKGHAVTGGGGMTAKTSGVGGGNTLRQPQHNPNSSLPELAGNAAMRSMLSKAGGSTASTAYKGATKKPAQKKTTKIPGSTVSKFGGSNGLGGTGTQGSSMAGMGLNMLVNGQVGQQTNRSVRGNPMPPGHGKFPGGVTSGSVAGGGGAGAGGADKTGKHYTSPYSQKYLNTARVGEIDQ